MNKIITILFIIVAGNLIGQKNLTDDYGVICWYWGYMKYNDPAINSSKINWDKALLDGLHSYDQGMTATEVCEKLQGLEQYPFNFRENKKKTDFRPPLFDLMYHHPAMSEALQDHLNLLVKTKKNFPHTYLERHPYFGLKFIEKDSTEWSVSLPHCRILTLARYWNAMLYFNPYIKDHHAWYEKLHELIPVFLNAQDEAAFYKAILQMQAGIHDSHSPSHRFPKEKAELVFGKYYITDIQIASARDTLFVSAVSNDSPNKAQPGDILLAMNDRPIKEWLDSMYTIGSFSFYDVTRLKHIVSVSPTSQRKWTVLRNGIEIDLEISYSLLEKQYKIHAPKPEIIFPEHIGYIDLAGLKMQGIKDALAANKNKTSLILDLRCYPDLSTSFYLEGLFSERRVEYAHFFTPDPLNPGSLQRTNNKTPFLGKRSKQNVIVLVSEATISAAETTAMEMQTSSRVKLLGTHTAGTNGDVRTLPLPGNHFALFSSIGVQYPDGTPTQHCGLRIDYPITPSVNDYMTGDPFINAAIEILKKQ